VLPVSYQDGQYQVKASIRSDKGDPSKAVAHYVYASYTQGQAITQQGGYSGRLFQGRYEVFYPNKQLLTQGQYHAGMAIGYWKHWHLNGKLKAMELYSHGRLHGPTRKYNEQGELIAIARYSHGVLHGCSKVRTGARQFTKSWYRRGVPVIPLHQKVNARWKALREKWATKKVARDSSSISSEPPKITN
jgi:hypothetical protein